MRVVVLHMPAEFGAFAVAQQTVACGTVFRSRCEMLRLIHAHFVRRDRQHQRGFDVAAVHAEAVFVFAKCVPCVTQRQLVPVA